MSWVCTYDPAGTKKGFAMKNNATRKYPIICQVDPLDLELDPKNPRLTSEEEGSPQPQLIKIMIERFKIEELGESIIASGFLEFDPLIGWEHNSTITIVEGNRRLAAIKLLLKPKLAPERYRETWEKLSGQLSPEHRDGLRQVSVKIYKDRSAVDLTAYIGFRHVTGVLQWPALEKASFIAQRIEQDKWSYKQIAERLGTYSKHVERHYIAHQIVAQAFDEGLDTKGIKTSFGVLMRALQAVGVREFLGVTYPGDPRKSRRPVPKEKMESLRYFVEWTFGTQEKAAVVRDSRQLTKWGRILQSPEAVSYMKRTSIPDFDRAYFRSGGQAESLAESLGIAADRLEETVPLVAEHKKSKDVEAEVGRCAQFLVQILQHFPKICERYNIVVTLPGTSKLSWAKDCSKETISSSAIHRAFLNFS